MKKIICFISMFMPWMLKRFMLINFLGYEIEHECKIGFSWIFPIKLKMKKGASIGSFTVCKGLLFLQMDEFSYIGGRNWISAYPKNKKEYFFNQERFPALIMGKHSGITRYHLFDCSDCITIGKFTTVAGYLSQLLTHSIDLESAIQKTAPVTIGDYCFVGTNCVILGGSELPNYSVLGAKSLLNKKYHDDYYLYAGVPARPMKQLPTTWKYFHRTETCVR